MAPESIKKLAKLEQYSDFHSSTAVYLHYVPCEITVYNATGAVYRYYESRRRKFKDSAEGREVRVKTNESKSKKRRSQKKVNYFH